MPSPRNSGFSWPMAWMPALASVNAFRRAIRRPFGGVLVIGVRDVADGFGAGLLADGVAAHAVGHQEQVAMGGEPLGVAGRVFRVGVLVVAAADADVAADGVLDLVKAGQR